jgi:hypothetical protein
MGGSIKLMVNFIFCIISIQRVRALDCIATLKSVKRVTAGKTAPYIDTPQALRYTLPATETSVVGFCSLYVAVRAASINLIAAFFMLLFGGVCGKRKLAGATPVCKPVYPSTFVLQQSVGFSILMKRLVA